MADAAKLVSVHNEGETLLCLLGACSVAARTAESTSQENGSMARRRHQTGRVIVCGKNPPVFVGRWREDAIQGNQTNRVARSMALGTVADLTTKRLAPRLLHP